MGRRCTMILAAACLLALSAWAPLHAEVRHPTGTLPTKMILSQDDELPIPVWVAYEGYEPRELPGPDAPVVKRDRPLHFLDTCYMAGQYSLPDPRDPKRATRWTLLVRADLERKKIEEYLGWIEHRYLIDRPEALVHPTTTIHKKALIVNSLESIRAGEARNLRILNAPRDDAPGKDEPYRLYNILFIYAEADGYSLVGASPTFKPEEGSKDARLVVQGWIPRNRICEWNNREGFEWDSPSTLASAVRRRPARGEIYRSIADARAALAGKTSPEVLFKEAPDDDGVSPPFPHDAPRFPLLEKTEVNDPVRGALYKVGGIGGFYDSNGKPLVASEKVNNIKTILDQVKAQVGRTEVLFVVDDTLSMKEWFKEVAVTVQGILDVTKADRRREVRIAVTYYNDITPANKVPVKTSPLKDLRAEGETIIDELKKHEEIGGGDPHEMMFRGVIEGVKEAGFSSYARKIVIVVGDSGDRSAIDAEYRKVYNEEAVLKALFPRGQAPIEFYGVQVVKVDDRTPEEHYQDFKKQVAALSAQHKARMKELGRPPGAGYLSSTNKEEVRKTLRARYDDLQAEALTLKGQLDRLSRGQFGTRISPELKTILERRLMEVGVSLESLMKVDGFQLFEYGYVWSHSPEEVPQIRKKVLLNDGDLQELTEVLGKLRLRNKKQRPVVRQVLAELIKQQAGDKPGKEKRAIASYSLTELVDVSKGLEFRSPLLRDRIDKLNDNELKPNEYFEVLLKVDRLNDARKNQEHRYVIDEEFLKETGYRRWEQRTPVPRQRGFRIPGDEQLIWYWIDYDEEWP